MSEPFLINIDDELNGKSVDSLAIRNKIEELEKKMFESPNQIHIEPVHRFADGLYSREITIPKGTLLTGLIHKFEHINIISKGKILVLTEDGPKTITAPHTMVSQPGTKRVGYAIEDTVWTTVHASPKNETDIQKLEAHLVTNTHDDLITQKEINLLKGATCLL